MFLEEGATIPKSRDSRRESDIRQINIAMDMYYDDNGKYVQSETLPNNIGDYLNPVPKDPTDIPCSYQWISNMNNPQKYCVWTCLPDGNFIVANEIGVTTVNKTPTSLDCWNKESVVINKKNTKIFGIEYLTFIERLWISLVVGFLSYYLYIKLLRKKIKTNEYFIRALIISLVILFILCFLIVWERHGVRY